MRKEREGGLSFPFFRRMPINKSNKHLPANP